MLSNLNIAIAATASDEVSVFDRQLNIQFWNTACEKDYGYTEKDAVGKPLLELFPFIEKDYRVHCLTAAAESGEEYFFSCVKFHYKDGYYSQVIHPLRKNGEPVGVLNIVRQHEPNISLSKEDLLSLYVKTT